MTPFNVVVADPPWQTDDKNQNGNRGAASKYAVMPIDELCSMPLPPIADNAWLFLWRLSCMQPEAFRLAAAWGFEVKTELVWYKTTCNKRAWFGLGHYTRAAHETCLVCVRGKVTPANRGIRDTFRARVPRENWRYLHSGKPQYFYGLVEELTGPSCNRLELFGRRQRAGWTVLGHEANKFAPVGVAP